MRAAYAKYNLHFKVPSGTSRGILTEKETFFIKVWRDDEPSRAGWGECALFRGLSADDKPGYEECLAEVCRSIDSVSPGDLREWSSIRFGLESALADLKQGGQRLLFPSDFTRGNCSIEINGLIWMGDKNTMLQRIEEKLRDGFRCIKLKIGAIDFDAELSLLKYIRSRFGRDEIELRVDANGAFAPDEALSRLDALSRYDLHSIEQPIRQGQWKKMAELCRNTPLPIALDEELIGVNDPLLKAEMLDEIAPQYIILKPALAGGFSGSEEWIELASRRGIGWWVTSALESNIGLNAIAQWTAVLPITMPQGLGTGALYTDNIPSPLRLSGSRLSYGADDAWQLPELEWK